MASLHEAAFDDAHWPATSGLIDEVCRTKGNSVVLGDQSPRGDVEIFFTRFCYRGQRDNEAEQVYFGVYHPLDERVPRIRQLPDGQIVRAVDLFSERERKASLVYTRPCPAATTRTASPCALTGRKARVSYGRSPTPQTGAGLPIRSWQSNVFFPICAISCGSGTRWSMRGRLEPRSPVSSTTRMPASSSSTGGDESRTRATVAGTSFIEATGCRTRTGPFTHRRPRMTPNFNACWPAPCRRSEARARAAR